MNLKFSQLKPSFKMKDIICLEVHVSLMWGYS